MENITKLGWIGLGNMGVPMCKHLLDAGFDIKVWNRSPEKGDLLELSPSQKAISFENLIESSQIIFTILSDDKSVQELYAKLYFVDINKKLFINLTTISPETSQELAQFCQGKGAHYLESPVSGSVKPAQEASLVILAGGSTADYDIAKPYLSKLGKSVLYIGEVGQAAQAKLAINYYLALSVQGLAETVLFAQGKGISRETMLEIINQGACASGISQGKTPGILKNDFPPAFPLKYMEKDIRLVFDQGLKSDLLMGLKSSFAQAMEEGLGEQDLMAIISCLEKSSLK